MNYPFFDRGDARLIGEIADLGESRQPIYLSEKEVHSLRVLAGRLKAELDDAERALSEMAAHHDTLETDLLARDLQDFGNPF